MPKQKLILSPPHPDGLDEVDVEDAIKRVVAYCCAEKSGWHTYDRPSHAARREGVFDSLSPWSLLWAEALNGRVRGKNLLDFTAERRTGYAHAIQQIGQRSLADLDAEATNTLIALCGDGFPDVWAAKLTKVLALYLPAAMPVLDKQVARSLGMGGASFRLRNSSDRKANIGSAVISLQKALRENGNALDSVRQAVTDQIQDFCEASDVRLHDIILWTSQADREISARGTGVPWRDVAASSYAAPDLTSISVKSAL